MKYLIPTLLVGLVASAVFLPSCYPTYGLTTTDYRTVVTVYDTAQDFNELQTFYLIDSVFHIVDEDEKDTITRKYDEEVIAFVASNYQSLGWTRITDTLGNEVPSTVVRISVTGSVNSGGYWNWWGGWYPGWGWGGWWGYPGWGWGGYYPPYWTSYEYTTGSLIVQQDKLIRAR